MDDMISRQALMKEFSDFVRASNNSDFARTPTWNDAVSLVGSMPSTQPNLQPTCNQLATDCISRQETIDAFEDTTYTKNEIRRRITELPSAQPEITYQNCSDALLKMWMDNVLTDGEYKRIMDKLNQYDAERRTDG